MLKNKIVLVPFPFDDFSGSKVRPAVCLTNEMGNFSHIVIAFITSQKPADPLSTDIKILKETEGFNQSGLAVNSTLRLHKLVTIPKTIIKRQLGKLSPGLQSKVKIKLGEMFEL